MSKGMYVALRLPIMKFTYQQVHLHEGYHVYTCTSLCCIGTWAWHGTVLVHAVTMSAIPSDVDLNALVSLCLYLCPSSLPFNDVTKKLLRVGTVHVSFFYSIGVATRYCC